MTSRIGTTPICPSRRIGITPAFRSASKSVAATPRRVAQIRSTGDGEPPGARGLVEDLDGVAVALDPPVKRVDEPAGGGDVTAD